MQAFQDGRFVTHALPFTMQTEMLEPEDLVRGTGLRLPLGARRRAIRCRAARR